jgi:hypothetical protein
MAALILDIETVGETFDAMDEMTQYSLTRPLKKMNKDEASYQAALQDLRMELGLSPLTAKCVALGILDAETLKGTVYYDTNGISTPSHTEENITYIPCGEKQMMERFWDTVRQYNEIVTFNGWQFDIPFINIRSGIHRVKPSRNLMSNRFLNNQRSNTKHIDLQDQLSYYAAVKRKGSLHLWCRALGIPTPKVAGSSGDDVMRMFAEGKYLDIARYNARDIVATKQLYDFWNTFLRGE